MTTRSDNFGITPEQLAAAAKRQNEFNSDPDRAAALRDSMIAAGMPSEVAERLTTYQPETENDATPDDGEPLAPTVAEPTEPTGDEFGKIDGRACSALLKLARVKQSEVAVAAATSQGTVCRRIKNNDLHDVTGTDIRRAVVRLAINSAGVEACQHRLATTAPTPTTATAPTPRPTVSATPAIAVVSPSAIIATDDIPKSEITEFNDAIFKIAGMLRRAIRQEDYRATFGLRKLVNAKRSYMTFRRAGFDHGSASSAAYYVAVSAREYGETEKTAVETYRAVFSSAHHGGIYDPGSIILKADELPGAEFDLPNEHPAMRIARPLLDAGENLWSFGPTGGGKTWAFTNHFRARRGIRPVRMQCNMNTVHAHLVGTFGLRAENGATVSIFQHAAIPCAMSAAIRGDDSGRGLPVIIDELSVADSGALMTLQAVLEGEPLLIAENGGQVVTPDPGFQVAVCDNSRGLGESAAYVGTLPVNEAFRDRFLFLEIGYSPNEKDILKATF